MKMNFRESIMLLPQGNKTEKFLYEKESNQIEVKQLKNQLSSQLNIRYTKLNENEKEKIDEYVEIHNQLLPLKKDIEKQGIIIDINNLSKVKTSILAKAKDNDHKQKLIKNFESLKKALNNYSHLNVSLSLIGTCTLRITTKKYNVQGLPKEVKEIFMPIKYKNIFIIDFKAFEPSVVAYITNDQHLKNYLNKDEGLYDKLLSVLSLNKEYRKLVKRAFIGSFLFGGNFKSDKFKLNQYISEDEWNKVMSKFSNVIKLKEQIDNKKIMKMPYGITHDMKDFHERSIMALYIQTVSSYIFKNILSEVYQHQCNQEDFRIMLPIHDAIMIECNTKEIAERVRQLMETSANRLFGDNFAHTTIEQMGGNHDDK